MILSEEDKKESLRVGQLIKKIEQIDEEFVTRESDLLFQKQPFLISLILGYQFDLKELELEEIMKIIFLIWEFFKNHNQTQQTQVSESQFMRTQQRNIHMLKYFEGEEGRNAKMAFISTDLENLKSKSLFTGILFQFNEKTALLNMKNETRAILLVGLKSLIECFEEIVFVNK
ncbi:MAG: hypothetical protein R6U95_10565 [Bacteroidales bacterium]